MFGLFQRFTKRPSLDDLQKLQIIAQQVVLSVEGSVTIPSSAKKELAMTLTDQMLHEAKVKVPRILQDLAVEASVKLFNLVGSEGLKPTPDFSQVDISRQHKTSSPKDKPWFG